LVMSNRTPAHRELTEALAKAGVATGASEAHGVICGVLSAATEQEKTSSWVPVLLSERDQASTKNVELVSKMLVLLHEQSQHGLEDANFDFNLLLPDDEQQISARVADLALWCSGYLMGLVAGGTRDIEGLPGDAAEIVKDMLRISEVIPGKGESEQQEKDLIELVEYVRLGTQAVYSEIHSSKPAQ